MKYACIRQHVGAFAVGLMCRVLGVSRAGYYAWQRRGPSRRAQADTRVRVAIRAIHAASHARYGRPRVQRALQMQGLSCGTARVARLMRLEGLRGKRRRAYRTTTQADGTRPAANHLRRQFRVAQVNQVWASDVTAWPTATGWLYVAVVLDLASRRVVGWAAGPSPGQELTLGALQQALAWRRPVAGLLHHSDRGAHYTGSSYQRLLAARGLRSSMSRRGDCWDNAVVESFFATLKTELVAGVRWATRGEARDALQRYLAWYNGQRLHSTLAYLSPTQYEARLAAA